MKNKILSFIIISVVTAISAKAQTTIFPTNSAWKYKDNGSDQGTTWRGTSFNDSTWSSGNAQLGYGDGDEATVLNACGTVTQFPSCSNKYITYYFRKTFSISNVNAFTNYIMNFKRDDGIIVYINGTEVYRENMPTGTILYTTAASTACSDDGATIFTNKLSVSASKLVSGSNTIAVEVHQNVGTSSDITFEMELLGETISGGASLTRGPYIQKVNSNSAVLRWRTDVAVDSKVTYGIDTGSMTNSATDTNKVTEHTIALTGLNSYTRYYYTIGSTKGVIQGGIDNYILTAPPAGKEGKYTFWVAGDCGNNSTNQQQVLSKYNTYIGNNMTDGFLLLGDNAYNAGTDAEFSSNFFNIYKSTILKHASLWPVPGNHDYANDATRQDDHNVPYFSIFDVPSKGEAGGVASNTEAFYSYNYGNIHFLALDSYGEEANLRLYDTLGAQVQWIKKDLDSNRLPWVIAYWHHPPYTMASHNSDSETELVKMRTNFIQILERYGVDMVLCGHSHGYERSKLMKGYYGNEAAFDPKYNVSQSSAVYDGTANSCPYFKDSLHKSGTVYIVAGSAGQLGGQQSTYPHNAMHTSNVTNGGSMVLEIEGNRLDAKWLCADGIVRDKFTIMKEVGKTKTYQLDLGDSATFKASWNGTYNWNNNGETSNAVVVKPTKSKQYIAGDNYNCLADTFDVKLTIPTIKTTSALNKEYCANSTINIPFATTGKYFSDNNFIAQLSDSSGNFSNPLLLGQKNATGSSSLSVNLPAVNVINNGTNYKIRIISTNPAITDTAAVTNGFLFNNEKPQLTFNSSDGDNSICKGDPVTFTTGGALTYQFLLNGNVLSNYNSGTTYFTDSLKNNQIVMAIGKNACGTDSASVSTIVLNPPKTTFVSSDADNSICVGEEVNFTADGADLYEFFLDSVTYGYGVKNTFKSPAITNGQQAFAIGYNICGQDTSAKIRIKVNELPKVTLASNDADNTIFENETVYFTAKGAAKYEFFINGVSQGVFFTGNFNTSSLKNGQTVTVKGISDAGCIGYSNAITTKVNRNLSVNGIVAHAAGAIVYPNPAGSGDELTIIYFIQEGGKVNIEITDINGRLINTIEGENELGPGNHETKLDLEEMDLKAGIYFIKINILNHTETIKLSVIQ